MDCGNWQERQLSHNYSLKCCNEVCKFVFKAVEIHFRWNAVCGESRMHGAERGKIRR